MVKRYEASGDNSSENKEYSTIEYEKATYYYGVGLEYETTSKGTYYHHYNNVGNTLLLTDKNSKVVEEYSYGVYGELLSGDASKTKFLYNGQLGIQTEESGLYYMRSRFYNPEIKRFINQDTLRGSITNSQSLNRYSYVQGNPVSLTDPFGTSPFKNLVQGLKLGADILMEMASIFVPGGIFVKAGYEMLKGNGAQAIKDLAFNLVAGAVVGAVAGLVVKGGAKALGAIGRTIKNSKPGKGLANTFQKAPKIFNGKNADKVDDFARGLSRNTNKVADDVAESVVKKSNKTDDVASKVGKGRKTGQGSIVPTVDRGNRTPRPTNYSYGVDDAIESGNSSRHDRTGYQSNGRSNNLFRRDRSTRRTTNLTEWRRSISQQDIHNEMRLFLGDDYVKVDSGKWRSLDGIRQFRVKPDDYLGNHGIGQPTVPNTPHVHFEFLTPRSNGNGFDVIKNIHVPIK